MAVGKKAVVLVVAAAVAAGAGWGFAEWQKSREAKPSVAWGSVDAREVSLAFEGSGRIAELLREEGEAVKAGDVIGRLDTRALEIERRRAEAQAEGLDAQWRLAEEGFRKEEISSAKAELDAVESNLALARKTEDRQLKLWKANATTAQRLAEEGFRKEEISSAKAELDAVESNLALARKTEDRQLKLWKANATTAQNVDNARWSRIVLEKQAASARAVYELKVAGLRPDEVRQTKAALDAGRAAVDSLTYQIETAAVLVSPVNGVVRTRMAEPGDMASAARTVYQISIMDPKWVRAYVSETQLKYVQEGAEALVTTDTTEPLKARVGHISSEAEFTPKTVATQDLRTVLVYEVRLNVEDPGNRLRLGQPVTVDFAP